MFILFFCFQNSAAVLSIVSLLHDAKIHVEKYPSQAVDSGSAERNTIHLMTRILNSMSSSCEYSATQAVGTALGLQAQFCMHNRCFLYADQAIEYVSDKHLRLNQANMDDIPDDPSVASSFSSGIYSDDDSGVVSSESDVPSRRASSADDPQNSAQPVELSQDEEFGPTTDADELQLSDTDSDIDVSTHQRINSLL